MQCFEFFFLEYQACSSFILCTCVQLQDAHSQDDLLCFSMMDELYEIMDQSGCDLPVKVQYDKGVFLYNLRCD